MRGKVFLTSIDHLDIEPHPHLIALVDKKQCLVIPAYTEGRHKITEKIDALLSMAYREDQVCVRMDNAKYLVNCVGTFKPHRAIWFTWQAYWADKRTFDALAPTCDMTPDGHNIIARALLLLHEVKPELMVAKQILRLRDWLC